MMACRKDGLEPGRSFDLSSIRTVAEAGSPLPPEGYTWVYEQLGADLLLNVGSGGTDVCSGLVRRNPLLPVYAGEISGAVPRRGRSAFDLDGRPVVGELGELVIRRPMPSMPVGFWNDPDGSRYRAAYFEQYPGVWRHGDWIEFTERGSCVITGRSDATLNRGGVRLGTAEFYGVVEELAEVARQPGRPPRADRRPAAVRRPPRRRRPRRRARAARSPTRSGRASRRDTGPTRSTRCPAIPRTMTGKKLELPVKRIIGGAAVSDVASRDALVDPAAIEPFVAYARERAGRV